MEYFGNNLTNENYSNIGGITEYSNIETIPYVCPGSGDVAVNELGINCYTNGSTSILLAIYDHDRQFVMQGASLLSAPSYESRGWISHTTFKNQAGSIIGSPVLDGGASYILAYTSAGNDGKVVTAATDDANVRGDWSQYTSSGYPATLSTGFACGTWYGGELAIRVGVTPASGGGGGGGRM